MDGSARRKEIIVYLSNFTSNHVESGGAICVQDKTLDLRITKSFFANNTATTRVGGAVDSIKHLNLFVEESFFSQNAAAYCGVFNFDSIRLSNTMKLNQSTFTCNQANGGSDIRSTLHLQGRRDNIGGFACIRNATISILKILDILKEKHPHPEPPHSDVILSTDIATANSDFHPVLFDSIVAEAI